MGYEHIKDKGFDKNPQNINRKGYPKGKKNQSTILKELLDQTLTLPDPMSGEVTPKQASLLVALTLLKKAIKDEDLGSIKELYDRVDGKARQTIEQTTTEIKGTEYDDLSAEKKAKILKILSE